jgi:hypothetical protein
MSLKQEIETWVAALAAYDNNEFDNSLRCFEAISDTSKILFNLGVIHATLGEHGKAVECYQRAVQLDQYLAVAYFQQGVSNFLLGDFEEALANFNDTLLYLRGNRWIDYDQLGLKFKLYSCEVLFNRGLCYIYLQQKDAGLQDLVFAAREKAVLDHDVIDEAIREQAEGYTVFSIPVGVIYRPNEAKVKNLKKQDYLGKARLVAAHEQQHTDPRRRAALAAMGIDDRPGEKLSYAALNLVRPGLSSRSRQQSEPPMHRNVFPPTPPPELERPEIVQVQKRRSTESLSSQFSSVQSSRPSAKPLRLDLEQNAQNQKDLNHVAASQTARSAATTTSNDPITVVKLTSQSLILTSNPTRSKPTALPPQSQYPRHSRHTRDPTHNTPALAPAPTPCTKRTTPSSKSPKQRMKASIHPPPSPHRLPCRTKSSHQIDTPPDHVTNAHNHGVPLFPLCGRSASKSTPQKIHDT